MQGDGANGNRLTLPITWSGLDSHNTDFRNQFDQRDFKRVKHRA